MNIKKVAITGGAGHITYSLLFRIANGDLFGKNQPVSLHILEIPEALDALKGVVMELNDCCFKLLQEVKISSDPMVAFEDVDWAILVGAKPRGPNMERKDLLSENGKIFVEQGKALNKVAKKSVQVFVIGNPCNTNCLIAMHNAPDLSKKQFFAMTKLDENRAKFQLAQKAGKTSKEVSNVTIWGNHSSTQVPDFFHAKINNIPVEDVIKDKAWLEKEFLQKIQKRGAEIIKARGKSSAASAASAVIDSVQSMINPTVFGDWYSLALHSKDNPYHIDPDLIFSFPCITSESGKISIVKDVKINSFLEEKIKLTEKELKEERDMVSHLLKG